jgi:two-component system cell cycle sensor histidine kinase/response regulator CckA
LQNPPNLQPTDPDQIVILIAEDDVILQDITRLALESAGYFVMTADNGEDALDIARKYSGPIHMLLSDIEMPKVNGLELKKLIQSDRPSTVVVLMSGKSPETTDRPFIQKPFTPERLRTTVSALLQHPPTGE